MPMAVMVAPKANSSGNGKVGKTAATTGTKAALAGKMDMAIAAITAARAAASAIILPGTVTISGADIRRRGVFAAMNTA